MPAGEHTDDHAIDDFTVPDDRLGDLRTEIIDALAKERHLIAYRRKRIACTRNRANSRTTVVACHSPPRGVKIPRLLSS